MLKKILPKVQQTQMAAVVKTGKKWSNFEWLLDPLNFVKIKNPFKSLQNIKDINFPHRPHLVWNRFEEKKQPKRKTISTQQFISKMSKASPPLHWYNFKEPFLGTRSWLPFLWASCRQSWRSQSCAQCWSAESCPGELWRGEFHPDGS